MPQKKEDRLTLLKRRVDALPEEPGVYRWIDAHGTILYIGKAKNLRKRMLSYVLDGVKRSAWTEMLVRQITDFNVTIVTSELEALILETNLIKNHRPKYNILMKDDKNYVYVRISKEHYPRIDVVRRMDNDGARYFGPKTSAEAVRSTLSFLRNLFPFRTCKMGIETRIKNEEYPHPSLLPKGERTVQTPYRASLTRLPLDVTCIDRDRPTPCIDHHIKQCLGPCIGAVTPEEYQKKAIDGVIAYFEGKYQQVESILQEQMREAVLEKKFEKAAKLRDQLKEIIASKEKQIVSDTSHEDADIIGIALLRNRASVVILRERNGKIIEEQNFLLQGEADSISEVLIQFLPQYIETISDIPTLIIVGEEPEEKEIFETWLKEKTQKKTSLFIPERGKKSHLLLLAEKNAEWKLRQTEAKWQAEERRTEGALHELQTLLHLPSPPKRIEGYDISHLGGTATVGSMVVMVNGKPKKEHYRSFNITTVKHGNIDDYQSLSEVLKRRLRYLKPAEYLNEKYWKEKGYIFSKITKKNLSLFLTTQEFFGKKITKEEVITKNYLCIESESEIQMILEWETQKNTLLCRIESKISQPTLMIALVLKKIKTMKEKKAYIAIEKKDEELLNEHGFRYVITPPEWLEKKKKDDELWMVFDAKENMIDASFTSIPDLLLIDGGKGQLSSIVKVLAELHLSIPVIGLAKREEEIFLPHQEESIKLGNTSEARLLIQRLRDEAHRFANDRRERRLDAVMTHSKLDEIPGIGEETKAKLLKKFGGADAALKETDDELRIILSESQLKKLREKFPKQ